MRGVEVAGIEEPADWRHCATLTAAALSWSSVNYSKSEVSLRPLSIHPARPNFPLQGGAATNWFLVHGSPHPVSRLNDILLRSVGGTGCRTCVDVRRTSPDASSFSEETGNWATVLRSPTTTTTSVRQTLTLNQILCKQESSVAA